MARMGSDDCHAGYAHVDANCRTTDEDPGSDIDSLYDENGKLRPWTYPVFAVVVLLWLPSIVKLFGSGRPLGIKGTAGYHRHAWEHFCHAMQGIFFAVCMMPWVLMPRWVLKFAPFVAHKYGRDMKNIAMLLGLIYPIYNLVKRSKTSCSEKHPETFWESSYFLNNMDIAVPFTTSALIGIALMYFQNKARNGVNDNAVQPQQQQQE